jgi:hypothetical protein
MTNRAAVLVVPTLLVAGTPAHADVVISSAATSNMSCTAGVCLPTAKNAILNAGDLETLLASGNVEVTTTGSGVQADSIVVGTALSWSDPSALTLDAYQTVQVENPVYVTGQGGLSVTTNDGGQGGYFGFGAKGHVTFANLSNSLTINGAPYTLVGDIATLAADVAANPSGSYALAASYNASKDGTYTTAPVATTLTGSLNGLGNEISHLSISDPNYDNVGLFAEMGMGGVISSIRVINVSIKGGMGNAGGLVGENLGTISNALATGSITLVGQIYEASYFLGGLVGFSYTSAGIFMSSANIRIEGSDYSKGQAIVGGLAGASEGTISQSYARGTVFTGSTGFVGGLTGGSGNATATITQSYADVKVSGVGAAGLGGLVGDNASSILQSYSIGALKHLVHPHPSAGGVIGEDDAPGSSKDDYWDTTTSKIQGKDHGAGRPRHDPGITGLTTAQFQSGLPNGFDPTVWSEDPNINNGLPYLINNPPQK